METIELVIRISEKHYNMITDDINLSADEYPILHQRIAEGVVLPKGHGRLIDADALKLTKHDIHVEAINYRHRCVSVENIDEAPTIIEADKEGAEE